MIEILYQDRDLIACVKPAGIRATDEPGGLPEMLREQLVLSKRKIKTVHRLDQVVSGVTVLAVTAEDASLLSAQIRQGLFQKEYLAVVHGITDPNGRFEDLLCRNKEERKTFIAAEPGKDTRNAILTFQRLAMMENLSLVRIQLQTGRTHQIRCQFSGHGYPLVGDRKYGITGEECVIGLWSWHIACLHPYTGNKMIFSRIPPDIYPWNLFKEAISALPLMDNSSEE